MDEKKITIAIIISSSMNYCRDFLYFHKLNPECFIVTNDQFKLHGLDPNIPVIVTHYKDSDKFYDLMRFVEHRFKNIRHIDY